MYVFDFSFYFYSKYFKEKVNVCLMSFSVLGSWLILNKTKLKYYLLLGNSVLI